MPYVEAGAGIVTFHVESTRHPHRVLQSLAGTGVVRGVAVNPGTPVSTVVPLLDEARAPARARRQPGLGRTIFLPLDRTSPRRSTRVRRGPRDRRRHRRGHHERNVEHVASLGVDLIVTGSAIYDGVAPADNARVMLEAVRRGHAGIAISRPTKQES